MIPVEAEGLAEALREVMEQDHDRVLTEFVEEQGRFDPMAWLAHLERWELAPAELIAQLRAERSVEGDAPRSERARRAAEGKRRARFRKVAGGLRQTGGFEELDAKATPTLRHERRDGRYEFVGTIGEGAMGRVELARDRVLQRRVAYKSMSDGLEREPVLARRFATEVRITAQLDHPNIVPIYALEGDHAYTMKWVEGRTLSGLLEDQRQTLSSGRGQGSETSRNRLLDRFLAVCDAVAYAHARGVVHRDLKPDNVMIGPFGETYVMDWGIARVFRKDVPLPVEVPEEEDEGGLVIGTPGYMSPEQASGQQERVGPASDQYALGLMLFEVLALAPAVSGKNSVALVTRNQEGETDPLRNVFGQPISREMAAVVAKATSASATRRYPSVEALADDVRRAQRGEPVLARPEGPIARLSRAVARRADAFLVVFVVLVLSAFGAAAVGIGVVSLHAAGQQAAEQTTRAVLTTAASHAARVEGQLLKFEGLVSVVATTATEALAHGPPEASPAIYRSRDYRDASTAPPDASLQAAGTKYGEGLVSASSVVAVVAPEVDPTTAGDLLSALVGPAERHLPRVLIRSHDERRATAGEALLRRTVLDVPIPARRAWIALEPGVLVASPGQVWPTANDDPRTLPAFGPGLQASAPTWLPPSPDIQGRPVVSVVLAIPGADGASRGVAAVEVDAAWMREQLLLPEAWRGVDGVRGRLLDAEGRVVLSTADEATGAPVSEPALAAAITERRSGQTLSGGRRILHHRLASNGWWSVVDAPEGTALGE